MAEAWKDKRKRAEFSVYFALTVLFLVTRFWKLTDLPLGMHIDEASLAYTSWCLAEYGVDRYLNPWPVLVPNFAMSQSAMYVYACALLFKLFGYHFILVRLPAVLFSLLNFIFGILTARKLFSENKIIPPMAGGLIVVCPYFIMAARFGLDCNLMLGMSTVFLFCFIRAIESGRMRDYALAGVTGGLVLYTYALSYIALPIFFVLALAYLLRVKRFSFRGWLAMAIPMGVFAFPLILVQVVNIFDLRQFQLGCFTIAKLGTNRAAEIQNYSYERLRGALGAVLLGDELKYNTAPEYGTLYGVTVVFFVLGAYILLRRLWKSVRDRRMEPQMFPLFWLVGMLFLGAHIDANANRMNGAFYGAVLLAAVGIDGLCSALKKQSVAVAAVAYGIYLLCFGNFAGYYYLGGYQEETFPLDYFDVPVAEAVGFVERDEALRGKTTQMAEHGIYYLLGELKSPYELDVRAVEEERRWGNYVFGSLGAIEDSNNYIVRDNFVEYSEELRAAGFGEERYEGYSLFYKK